MRVWHFAVCLGTLLFVSSVHARFVVEQGGINVKFPASARQKYKNG